MKKRKLFHQAVNAAAEKAGIDGKLPDQIDLNFTKKLKANGLLGIILAVCVFIFSASAYLYNSIPKTAAKIGSAFGNVTGLAAGSFQASLDVPDTNNRSAEDTVSPEETKAVIESFAHECGVLEVMRTDVKFADLYNTEDTWYSLSQKSAKTVCTADLSQAEYDPQTNTLTIPAIDISLELGEAETLAQYTASEAENKDISYTGTISSEIYDQESARQYLMNDSVFMDHLRQSAEEKILSILGVLLGEETEIHFEWKEPEIPEPVYEEPAEEAYTEEGGTVYE